MNWKLKSVIQRACHALPVGQQAAYYGIQRTLGRYSGSWNPTFLLSESARLAKKLTAAGHPVEGAVLMEIGTGRTLDMPTGFFLCGAKEVHTWDLYRLLKDFAVADLLTYIHNNEGKVRELFEGAVAPELLTERLAMLRNIRTIEELAKATSIRYHAPADASRTGLPDSSIDIQTSYTVFEHIPPEVLIAILKEANRILKSTGAAMHHIDPSDHFSHTDPGITPINFLQFSLPQWVRYSSNSFAYHNRLRPPAYREIYQKAGHAIEKWEEHVDPRSLAALRNGFPLDSEFRNVPLETLAVSLLQVLSRSGA